MGGRVARRSDPGRRSPRDILPVGCLLRPQHLYEFEEDTRFPTTKFQVVKTPRTGRLLAFNCLGAYLPPSSRLGPFSLVDYQSGHVLKDGDL